MAARIRLIEEPLSINRCAIVVRPGQRFLDWLHEIDSTASDITLEDLCLEPRIYLLPELDSEADVERVLKQCFDTIFVDYLDGWHRDESVWPSPRSYRMFKEWFEWSYHSMLTDLAADALVHDLD